MSLAAGTRLGPYEVLGLIGAGGMGEVYKARDTRLDRTVAIKILPAELSADPDRRARFEREAKAISQLNHPHICALHDIGESVLPNPESPPSPTGLAAGFGAASLAPVHYIVMEHLAGETLADRLTRGPLPLAQALDIAAQIAEALDAAHKHGIIHRDLKPGNVMLATDGSGRSGVTTAKLLDFGLAKLAGHGERPALAGDATAPTMTAPVTARGTILGTLQYMAPEQLEGKDADARTDLWALGAMLYEMLTGRRAFEGESQMSLAGNIMNVEPPALAELQPLTPPSLERVVRKCLAKAPDERWDSAADLAGLLRWIAEGASGWTPHAAAAKHWQPRGVLVWAAAAGVAMFVSGAALSRYLVPPPPVPQPVIRATLALPAEAPLAQPKDLWKGFDRASLAISADGRRMAYVAVNGGVRRLYVKQVDELQFRRLNGTEGASDPFFRPDGEWLGFFSAGKLKKVSFTGGQVSPVCEANAAAMRGSWDRDGWIVYADGSGRLIKVSAEGGSPSFDPRWSDTAVCLPRIQPDREWMLATGCHVGGARFLSLASGALQAVFDIGSDPILTSTGHLVAAGDGVLRAAPFDAKTRTITGDEITVVEGLRTTAAMGAQYALSETGTLLYALGGATDEGRLVRVDRTGQWEDLAAPTGIYQHVSVAPRGDRLAVSKKNGARMDIFTIDLRRPSLLTQLTSDGALNRAPVWNPDGDRVAYCSDRGNAPGVWLQAADAGMKATRLVEERGKDCIVSDWSEDERTILIGGGGESSNTVVKVVDMGGGAPQSRVLFDTGADAWWGQLDRNQRWLLYTCGISGVAQICIRSWPEPSSKVIQISTEGGIDPLWSPDGTELFYRNGSQFLVVPMPTSHDSVETWIPQPQLMFRGDYLNVMGRPWDVTPDGQHFIMLQLANPLPPRTELHLVVNWFEELKAKVPDR